MLLAAFEPTALVALHRMLYCRLRCQPSHRPPMAVDLLHTWKLRPHHSTSGQFPARG
jgi:hypothetical protein